MHARQIVAGKCGSDCDPMDATLNRNVFADLFISPCYHNTDYLSIALLLCAHQPPVHPVAGKCLRVMSE